MLRTNKKSLILASIVTLIPAFVGVYLWNRLPDVMATHFGTNNQANGFSSKPFAVFGIPVFCLACLWVSAIVTSKDPRKQNISPKVFRRVLWIAPLASLIVAASIYPFNLGIELNTSFYAMLFIGIILIFLGNYMPKTRQNYTIGIKLPWTLASEDNWNHTHRLAGFLWVIAGIVIVVAVLGGIMDSRWLMWFFIVVLLIPCIYSFVLHVAKGM